MMHFRIVLQSTTLLRPVEVMAALPYGFDMGRPPYKTVWALHCAMGCGDFFFDSLGVGSIVEKEQVAIIAPSLGNGFFLNSAYECQADFLQDELMPAMRQTLPLSSWREDNFLVGVSMGGFGALRWALDRGESFAGIAAISGVFGRPIPMDEQLRKNRAQRALYATFAPIMRRLLTVDGEKPYPEADLDALLEKAVTAGILPRVFLYCGEQDHLSLPHTRGMAERCRAHGCAAKLVLSPGGHDMLYWRQTFHEGLQTLLSET